MVVLSLKHFVLRSESRKLYRDVLRALKGVDAATAAGVREAAREQFADHSDETDIERACCCAYLQRAPVASDSHICPDRRHTDTVGRRQALSRSDETCARHGDGAKPQDATTMICEMWCHTLFWLCHGLCTRLHTV